MDASVDTNVNEKIQSGQGEKRLSLFGRWLGASGGRLSRRADTKAKLEQSAALIRESELFDAAWYLSEYPDVAKAGIDPAMHYLTHGAFEGRNPSRKFDSRAYLRAYSDVRDAGANPLLHYLRYGRSEGRSATPVADAALPSKAPVQASTEKRKTESKRDGGKQENLPREGAGGGQAKASAKEEKPKSPDPSTLARSKQLFVGAPIVVSYSASANAATVTEHINASIAETDVPPSIYIVVGGEGMEVGNKYTNVMLVLLGIAERCASQDQRLGSLVYRWFNWPGGISVLSLTIAPKQRIQEYEIKALLYGWSRRFDLISIDDVRLTNLLRAIEAGEGTIYLEALERNVPRLITELSKNGRQQRSMIGSFGEVLQFSAAPLLLQRGLLDYATRELDVLRSVVGAAASKDDQLELVRRVDSALNLAFTVSPVDAVLAHNRVLQPAAEMLEQGAAIELPLFVRALRASFIKASTLATQNPSFAKLVANTNTSDARALEIILQVLRSNSRSYGEPYDDPCGLVRAILRLPKDAVTALARDLRRHASRASSTDAKSSWLVPLLEETLESEGAGYERDIWYPRMILLFALGFATDEAVAWILRNATRVRLSSQDSLTLLALAGQDRYVVGDININYWRKGVATRINAPSSCQDIVDYYDSCLKLWRGQAAESRVALDEMPRVSVVLTTYNPDIVLLERAVRSVYMQSYPNVELIVVDDCSDEELSEQVPSVIAKVAGEFDRVLPVICLRSDINIGQYQARNMAISRASGDFIAIQDDDDISIPSRIEAQIALMERTGAVACHGMHLRISQASRLLVDGNNVGDLLGDAPASFVWRAKVFETIGMFVPVRTRGDIEFRSRLNRFYGESATVVLDLPLILMYGGMETISASTEYCYKSSVQALRFMMQHMPIGRCDARQLDQYVPTLLRPTAAMPIA